MNEVNANFAEMTDLYQQINRQSSLIRMRGVLEAVYDLTNHCESYTNLAEIYNDRQGVDTYVSFLINNVNDDQFRASLKILTNKSYLVSIIANPARTSAIKRNLIAFGKLISNVAWDQKLYMQIIKTPFTQFDLLNLFITNNQQPQLLNLGVDCSQQMNLNDYDTDVCFMQSQRPDNALFALNKVLYTWQADNPLPVYEKQIVNLDSQAAWEKAKPKILRIYQRALQHELKQVDVVNAYDNQTLRYLDLVWFMTMINNCCTIADQDSLQKPEAAAVPLIMQKLAADF